MKRNTVFFIVVFVGVCSLAFAEEQDMQGPDATRADTQQNVSQGDHQGMMGQNRMNMKGGPMMMGMRPSVTPTSDGGVVVLMGNKLAKYDSSLTLVNEVELKGGPKPRSKRSDEQQMAMPSPPPREEPVAQPSTESDAPQSATLNNDPA